MSVQMVKAKYEMQLMGIPGVQGTGIGRDSIIVYVVTSEVAHRIPTILDGVPVTVIVSGIQRPLR